MNIERIQRRINYYKSAFQSIHEFGGKPEVIRSAFRIVMRKPSDEFRKLRWKVLAKHASVDKAILDFKKFKLMVDANDEGIAAELALDKVHEPIGTKILLSILRDDMTLIELGANIGYYTMQEATQAKLKRIVAIEPNPISFEILKTNIEINHCDNVDLLNVGISDVDGELPFYISKHSNICSITPRENYEKKINVPVMKMDTLIENQKVDKVDIIRMDIEGHEINAVRSMKALLERDKPWLCMEWHAPMIGDSDKEEFISTLEQLGYELKAWTFRWSDYPIFGHTIIDKSDVIKHGDLRHIITSIPSQVLLLFIAPKEAEYTDPKL